MTRRIFGSLTRIADLETRGFDVAAIDRERWATGDYVIGRVTGEPSPLYKIETPAGDMVSVTAGAQIVGAFGDRAATLEAVGSFRDIENGKMHAMTSAGLFGRMTSLSPALPGIMTLDYLGHAMRGRDKVTMRDFALSDIGGKLSTPTVLLFGTSMSAGKTEAGKRLCRCLSDAGRRVVGAKLTGAGRYRDILAFRDAGAERVFDFVDAGMPSTVVPETDFRTAIRPLLSHIAACDPDVLVAEAGASPLEPYNGAAAIDELGDNIRVAILCASDPYAVVGVRQAFGLEPDLVTGPATDTTAGVDLVRKLTGIRGINVLDPDSVDEFGRFVEQRMLSAGPD